MVREPQQHDVAAWMLQDGPVEGVRQAGIGIGRRGVSHIYLNDLLGLGEATLFAIQSELKDNPQAGTDALTSLPFFSLCKGFFLPLMGIAPDRLPGLFGLQPPQPLSTEKKDALVETFLDRELGLSLAEKVGLIFGDPFRGQAASVRHDTLCHILAQIVFLPVSKIREQLIKAGDLPSLFALSTEKKRAETPIASAVVVKTLSHLRTAGRRRRTEVLQDLFQQCGRLERYVLAGLILGKVHLNVSGRQDLVLNALSKKYGARLEALASAAALLDIFGLCDLLEEKGVEGLKEVTLKPLSPIRPALAGSTIPSDLKFPAWFECKYDGLRLMIHKDTDSQGRVLAGAFTRKRNDWSELIKGVQNLVQLLPCRSVILDGELHGTILDQWGAPRPATVYEVHSYLRGESPIPVNLKYVGFDMVYLNGHDLTGLQFKDRRKNLETLLGPLTGMPLPLPIVLSQGSRVENKEQLNRPFDSFTIACRSPEGFKEVGTVAGVDAHTSVPVVQTIMSQNLLTGRTVEHRGSRNTSAGVELAPGLVVSVKFEGIVRPDPDRVALRSPRIVRIRVGEIGPHEANSLDDLHQMQLKHGLG